MADLFSAAAGPSLSYATDPAWADLTPIPQHEPDFTPLSPILYSNEYRDAMDYFRAIIKSGERSERGLKLTEHLIQLNPAHYTVWQYRYETLVALGLPLEDELEWSDKVVKQFIKNYQGWHHRRLLISNLRNPKPELTFITEALKVDSKNYHTWAYRQWLLAEFNLPELWAGELDYIESLLDEDIRNNSAWHHRYFVVFGSGVREGDADREGVARRELGFTKHKISIAPNNLSAWNYLRGVLEHARLPLSTLKTFVEPYAEVREPVDPLAGPRYGRQAEPEVVDLDNPRPGRLAELPVPFAIEFLGDVAEEEEDNAKAAEIYKSLATQFDPARKRYWEFRIREIAA